MVVLPYRIIPLVDPVVETNGYPLQHPYITDLWLPKLGPTATWVLLKLDEHNQRTDATISPELLAASVGAKVPLLNRALDRLTSHKIIQIDRTNQIWLRSHLPPLTARQLTNIPYVLHAAHWLHETRRHQQKLQPEPRRTGISGPRPI